MRDKLIELIENGLACPDGKGPFGDECETCRYMSSKNCVNERLADYLIANGVTFAEPVKHGVWMERQIPLIPLDLDEDDVDTMYVCSECEGLNYCESPYCPNCGAKMAGEKDNDTERRKA